MTVIIIKGMDTYPVACMNRTKSNVSAITGKKLKRGFCQFVLGPIYRLIKGSLAGPEKRQGLDKYMPQLGIELKAAEKALEGKDLMKCVMPKFLPLAAALLEMMVRHLPSPVEAQRYRVENLYEGPMDDECADAIRRCDKEGPLMIYISKLVPSPDQGSRFYAFGRVFSGTVRNGQKVRIMGPDYMPGQKVTSFFLLLFLFFVVVLSLMLIIVFFFIYRPICTPRTFRRCASPWAGTSRTWMTYRRATPCASSASISAWSSRAPSPPARRRTTSGR